MKVSVIITAYNYASFLPSCIDSLKAQTMTDFEAIIVDDGSTDDTALVVKKCISGDDRFKYIYQANQGVSTARNTGIENTEGDFIVFIDGDDIVEDNHLATLLAGMAEADAAMVMIAIVSGTNTEIPAERRNIFSAIPMAKRSDFASLFENYLLSSPCDKIYDRSIIMRHGLRFDPKISYAEDLVFNLQYFSYISSIALISVATYHYVKHNGSGTTRAHKNISYTISKISESIDNTLPRMTDKAYQVAFEHILWGIINLFHKSNDLSGKQRLAEIAAICSMTIYRRAINHINNMHISRVLKFVLRTRSPHLIYGAMTLKFKR